MDDRRKYPRVSVLPANLRVTRAEPYAIAAIVDLSIGGMKLEVSGSPPRVGELLDVTLAAPAGDVQLNAMVRHVTAKPESDAHFVGVEFDDPELVEKIAGDLVRAALV